MSLRTISPVLLLVTVAYQTAACQAVGEGPPCVDRAELYPVCLDDGATALSCVDGEERRVTCERDETCQYLADDSGRWQVACLPPAADTCALDSYTAACTEDDVLRTCLPGVDDPVDDPAQGYVTLVACPLTTICRDDGASAACAAPDATPCDPERFAGRCDEGHPVVCPPSGYTWTLAACVDPAVCMGSAVGAVCVPPDATSCDPDSFDATCEDGLLLHCDAALEMTIATPCLAGTVCRDSGDTVACVEEQGERCDPAATPPRCDGASIITCSPEGRELAHPCPPATTCQASVQGAACVGLDARPCDTSVFAPHCVTGRQREVCDRSSGLTAIEVCPADQRCRTTPGGDAVCAAGGGGGGGGGGGM